MSNAYLKYLFTLSRPAIVPDQIPADSFLARHPEPQTIPILNASVAIDPSMPNASVASDPPIQSSPPAANVDAQEPHKPVQSSVKVYNIWTREKSLTIDRSQDSTSAALDLMRHGYIAKTPTYPEVAVSVTTLVLLFRIRQRKASFSIEAFAKVVCDFYTVCFVLVFPRRH